VVEVVEGTEVEDIVEEDTAEVAVVGIISKVMEEDMVVEDTAVEDIKPLEVDMEVGATKVQYFSPLRGSETIDMVCVKDTIKGWAGNVIVIVLINFVTSLCFLSSYLQDSDRSVIDYLHISLSACRVDWVHFCSTYSCIIISV